MYVTLALIGRSGQPNTEIFPPKHFFSSEVRLLQYCMKMSATKSRIIQYMKWEDFAPKKKHQKNPLANSQANVGRIYIIG